MGYTPTPPQAIVDPALIAKWARHYLTGDAAATFPSDTQLTLYIEEVTREQLVQYPEFKTLSDDDDINLLRQGLGALVAGRFVSSPLGAKLKGNQGTTQVKIAGVTRTLAGLTPTEKQATYEELGNHAISLISIFKVAGQPLDLYGAVRPESRWPF